MALINCPECGREISDKASACPHCGCPLEREPETATFILNRESKAYFCAVKYEVYLDYQFWSIMKNGDRLSETLICGDHHLKLVDKNNFNKVVYDDDFYLPEEGLVLSFSAAMKIAMNQRPYSAKSSSSEATRSTPAARVAPVVSKPTAQTNASNGRTCPRCGGPMAIQTISESRKSGCGTILLYVLLALTIFGLLIVIPLMLRKKTETVTYAVCQQCGYKRKL